MVNKAFRLLSIAFLLFGWFLLLPTGFFAVFDSRGLDPSWTLALHLAFERGLHFGSEFAFTYGPLGVLSTRLPFEGIRELLLASDLYLYAALLFFFSIAAVRIKSLFEAVCGVIAALCIGDSFLFADLVIVQFALMSFFILFGLDKKNPLALIPAAIFSLSMFYTKLNLGLVAVSIMVVALVYFAWIARKPHLLLLSLALYFGSLIATSLVLNVDLVNYIVVSAEIARGYNEAMSIKPVDFERYLWMAVTLLIGYYFVLLVHLRESCANPVRVAASSILGLFLFLLFKQSFVRADGHTLIFFHHAVFAVGIHLLFTEGRMRAWLSRLFILALIFSFVQGSDRFTASYLTAKWDGIYRYGRTALSSKPLKKRRPRPPPEIEIPDHLRVELKGKSIDFIPWEISYAYYYPKLVHYNPRPVMQSYSAYTEYLDELNARKYLSQTAPDLLFFALYCVDGRYCFFDESKTKLAMIRRYTPFETFRDTLVLRRRAEDLALTVQKQDAAAEYQGMLGQEIPLTPSENFRYITVMPRYSTLGRLSTIFYQPPELRVTFSFSDGTRQEFRAVKPILEGGVMINKFVASLDDARAFFSCEAKIMRDVAGVTFYTKDAWGFEKSFDYSFSEVSCAEH